MKEKVLFSKFAPAGRSVKKEVMEQYSRFKEDSLVIRILESVSVAILILNGDRQLVYANRVFLETVEIEDLETILGLRPGEALECVNSDLEQGGCGTSLFCSQCGAVRAILSSINGETDVQECRITRSDHTQVLELRVMASPLQFMDSRFTVFSVTDIADEKRREVLERIFLHDVKNTAGGLQGFTRLLDEATGDQLDTVLSLVRELADKLLGEIDSYHQLVQAERQQLEVHPGNTSTLELLNSIKYLYMNHDVGRGKRLEVDRFSEDITINTDDTILSRVLGNMVKNALEAVDRDQCVTLSCHKEDNRVRFQVHNPGMIPLDAQLQIFQRSFSTKGSGRGVGTYSIKLLGEQYLRGRVGFTSSETDGTAFYGVFPIDLAGLR
jgi:signal transduction histidine kinase